MIKKLISKNFVVCSVCSCGHSSMVERELPKLIMRVRFPLPAPLSPLWEIFLCGNGEIPGFFVRG